MVKLSGRGAQALLRITGHQSAPPRLIALEAANICTRNCPVCGAAANQVAAPRGLMDWALFKSLVREAAALHPEMICLHAHGEPLVHPRIVDMVSLLGHEGLPSHMASNADPLTPELTARLNQAGLDELIISHPALTPANFQASTGRSWSPEHDRRLMDCLDCWDPGRGELRIRCMIMPSLGGRIKNEVAGYLERWLAHPAVQQVEFHVYEPWPKLVLEREIIYVLQRPRPCHTLLTGLTVLWNGIITPCSYDIGGDLALGASPGISLARAYNHPRLRVWRRRDIWGLGTKPALCRPCLLPRTPGGMVVVAAREAAGRQDDDLAAWRLRTAQKVLASLLRRIVPSSSSHKKKAARK